MNITYISIVPAAAALLNVFFAFYFFSEKSRGFNEASWNVNDKEYTILTKYMTVTAVAFAAVSTVFVLFFVDWIKIIAALASCVLPYILGPAAFRIKHGKSVKRRVDKENEELEAQKRKEEMGKFS